MKKAGYQAEIKEALQHIRSVRGNVPAHRRESKHVYSFSALPFSEQLIIWDQVWRGDHDFWVKLHAYFFLERHLKKENELLHMWPVVAHWQQQVSNWGLCDALAKVYTKIMEVSPAEVYAQLKQWNRDENLWKRRQSVVSLLYYSHTKKQHPAFDDLDRLIKPLLSDKEHYVQKGIGWALREMHRVYPLQGLSWLKTNIKLLSPIAFTIAMEKLDKRTVDELKALRKQKG